MPNLWGGGEGGGRRRHTDLSWVFERKGGKQSQWRKESSGTALRIITRGPRLFVSPDTNQNVLQFEVYVWGLRRSQGGCGLVKCSAGPSLHAFLLTLSWNRAPSSEEPYTPLCQVSLLPFSTCMPLGGWGQEELFECRKAQTLMYKKIAGVEYTWLCLCGMWAVQFGL